MKTKTSLHFIFLALLIGIVGVKTKAQDFPRPHPDDYVYDEIVEIKGRVTILNHPSLGVTNGNGIPLVFRREGCKKCLIATRTDIDGNYEISVGRGKYKLILREARGGYSPSSEMLAPDQPRFINAQNTVQGEVFDIKVMLHK